MPDLVGNINMIKRASKDLCLKLSEMFSEGKDNFWEFPKGVMSAKQLDI